MHRMDFQRARVSVWSKSAIVFGLGLLALLAPAAQAQQAQPVVSQGPLNYFQNYFVTGDYVVGGVGGLSTLGPNPTATITLNSVPCTTGPGLSASVVPCSARGAVPADIIAAYLYWQTTETSKTPIATTGTFDANLSNPNASPFNPNLANEPMVGTPLGSPQIPACLVGKGTESTTSYARVYRADVLPYLSLNSTASVRTANYTHTIAFTGGTGTTFNGATLVVVYRLVTAGNPRVAPLRSVVIYDGAFSGVASRSPSLNQTMGGFYEASSSPNAKMTLLVGGGQKGYQETLTVNGNVPPGVSNPFVGAQGAEWDNYTFNYNLGSQASSVVTDVQSSNDCLEFGAIITSTNVQDSDFDGLLDIWETSGLYFNPGVRNDGVVNQSTTAPAEFGTCPAPTNSTTPCVNFPAMGAKPNVPDIFIQIDWMASTNLSVPNHTHIPQYAALSMVGTVFQSHGFNMHFDVGNNYQGQPFIVPKAYALGGNVVQESSVLCVSGTTNCNFFPQSEQYSVLGWKGGFGSIKDGDTSFPLGALNPLFNVTRKDSFHYGLFGHAIAASTPLSYPEAGSISGVGDLPGGDFLVTLGLWRSDVPAVDQVGTVLQQAGTLMHELGHNLDLHHGGWNNTPICMPDYPSVMNYLYQVAGLTDSKGVEHIDYSYGLELPMSENFISSLIPMGLQGYKVRYFGPFNSAIDTPGQASKVFCSGDLLNTGSISGEGQYVLLQGANVSTPDWSNGTVALGKLITSGLDLNFDGIGSQTFTDSPDWLSLNLQQVGARANAYAASADLGRSDGGTSDLGRSDGGTSDLGRSDGGTSQLGAAGPGDINYTTVVASGALPAPTGLTVGVTPTNSNTGATGNLLGWTGNTGVAGQYNIYRCNGSAGACTPTAPALASVTSGSPVLTTYTDSVNDTVNAGSTCPAASTCYNTTYYYYVTEDNATTPGVACMPATSTTAATCTETTPSNTVSSDVTHLTVVANSQTTTYGATNPTPTYTVYSNVASATSLTGVTCTYTTPPPANTKGYYDAGNYPITCTGPTVTGTEGITYYAAASLPLLYPANLGGTLAGITQGSLTVNQLPITVTAVCSTKVYNANTNAGTVCTPGNSATAAIPTITTNTLVSGDTAGFTESYDNPNVNSPVASHTMMPAGIVNDNNGGNNYKVSFFNSPATSVITPAPLTASIVGNPNIPTKQYNGNAAASLTSTNFSITGLQGNSDNFTVTQTAGTYNSQNVTSATTVTAALSSSYFAPVGGTLSTNYTFPNSASGPGAITPVTLTASIVGNPNIPTKPYDSTTAATLAPANFSLAPLVGTENFNVTQTAGTYNSPNVLNAATITAMLVSSNFTALSQTLASNYVLPATATGPGKITPVNANITVTHYSVTYDGNQHTAAGTATGVGTPAANLNADLSLSNTTHTNAGTYNADFWSFTDPIGNYNPVASTTITDTILKATANITITPYNVTYNGNPQTATGTATGVETPTPVNLSAGLALGGTTHTSAGTYPSDPWTFTDFTGNYNNASGMVTDIINQAIPVVTDSGPNPGTPDYGQPVTLTVTVAPPPSGGTPTGTVTFSFKLGQTTNYICSDGTFSTNSPACTVGLTFNGTNYVASVTTKSNLPTGADSVTGTYSGDTNFVGETANPQPVTVTVSQASSTVSLTKSANPSSYGTPVNLTVEVVDATGSSMGVPTGTVTLSFKLDPTDPNGQVYNICVDGSVITTPCVNPITLAPDSNNPIGATVTVQNIALPAGLAMFAGAPAPAQYSYPINATYSGDTNFAASGPYGLSQTVNQLAASVTPNSAGKIYGAADPTLTGTLSGFLSADNVTATYSRAAGETVAGSPYPISATLSPAAVLNNYNITYNPASFTITAASTTTTITMVSPSPATAGQPTTVTVAVAPQISGTPTGSVTVNASPAGTSCTIASFSAPTGSCMLTFTGSGPESLTATYTSGSTNFNGSTTSAATPLTVDSPLSLPAASLSGADQNVNYQQTLLASGGMPVGGTVYYWAVTSGALPTGLSLSPAGTVGTISGSPTASPGQYPFGVTVTDALGAVASQAYSITVNAPPSLAGGTLPNALVGTLYNYNIPVTAGTPPFTNWTCGNCSANLPAGLSFSNGNISGTATGAVGPVNITVSVNDAVGGTATAMYTITANTSGSLLGSQFNLTTSETGTVTVTPLGGPTPETVTGGTIFSFCVGPNANNCASSGMYGSATITANQVSFAFSGSTNGASGTFVIQMTGFTTMINNVTLNSGALLSGTFGVTSVTSNSMTFTGTTSGTGFDAVGGATITFNVAPLASPATFSATGSMSTARSFPVLTLLQNGQVLVTGGCSLDATIGPCNPLSSAELYDPTTGSFTPTNGPMQAARWVHTATLLPNGQVLITGGDDSTSTTLASAELYDPTAKTFSLLTNSMITPRSNHTATLLPNSQVLIAGGNTSSNDISVGPSAELYDPSTGVFTATNGSMGTVRYVANAALLSNGLVLIVGGISIPNNTYLSSAELYDPTAGTFSYTTNSMSTARGYFTATLLQNGQVLAAGGYNGSAYVLTADLYDPTAGTFSLLTHSMTNQQGGPATLLGNGQVLFAGGYNGSSLATSELYDPTAKTFSLTGSMTTPRNGPAATLLNDGQVLVVGGANSSGVLASAELYTPPN